jgi:hypothetical protein
MSVILAASEVKAGGSNVQSQIPQKSETQCQKQNKNKRIGIIPITHEALGSIPRTEKQFFYRSLESASRI